MAVRQVLLRHTRISVIHQAMNVRAFTFRIGPWQIRRKTALTILCSLVLIVVGLLVRYPGSVPKGWQQVNGTVSGTTAKGNGTSKQYYPVVQYLALGYSHDIKAKGGYSYAPDFGASFKVAFDPGNPADAVLLNDTNPNYFRSLPWLGLILPILIVAIPRVARRYSAQVLKAHDAQKHNANTSAKPVKTVEEPPKEEIAPQPEEKVIIPPTPELKVPAAVPELAFIGPRESTSAKKSERN